MIKRARTFDERELERERERSAIADMVCVNLIPAGGEGIVLREGFFPGTSQTGTVQQVPEIGNLSAGTTPSDAAEGFSIWVPHYEINRGT